MKNMKLRVVALILVIPLLLIFTTSSVTKTIDILVDIPVKSVTIAEIAEKNIDIASGNGVAINVAVEPSNATNATVVLTGEATKGKEDNQAQIIVRNGVVYPLTQGNVTVRASVGEKFDTVDLYFYSSKPMDDDIAVKNKTIFTKEGKILKASDNMDFKVEEPFDIEYSVDNKNVVAINKVYGTMQVLSPGKTTVRAKYSGIEVKDDATVHNVIELLC